MIIQQMMDVELKTQRDEWKLVKACYEGRCRFLDHMTKASMERVKAEILEDRVGWGYEPEDLEDLVDLEDDEALEKLLVEDYLDYNYEEDLDQ